MINIVQHRSHASYVTGFGKTCVVHTSNFAHSTIHKIQQDKYNAVAIGPVTRSVSCGYRSGSLIYDTLRMSTRRFVDLEI